MYRMIDDQGRRVKARIVKRWEVHGTDKGAALVFGMEMHMLDGSIEVVGDSPLILSLDQCRVLAANLVEIIDRMTGEVGRA
jgi:hypothetical protein